MTGINDIIYENAEQYGPQNTSLWDSTCYFPKRAAFIIKPGTLLSIREEILKPFQNYASNTIVL